MTAEMKAKWLEALRSGKYQQGKNFLREGDRYCCLGVLCELDGAKWTKPDSYRNGVYRSDHGEVHCPDDRRLVDLGLDREIAGRAAGRNDSGKSFSEIADWLEANLPVTS